VVFLENRDVLKRLYEIKKETGLQIGITTTGTHQSKIIEAALKVKIENEDLFDSYQVTYNILTIYIHSSKPFASTQQNSYH
jgi:hypothetical protein